ncbi:MAG: TetR/AcrR family transcriptional regulator [Anaerolineae bacterium]|jgi:AcrR family transcriptional regulator
MGEASALRDRIVENAGELFRQQGYAATSIKEIARASECTTAALYYYFEDGKEQILREVIQRSGREAEFLVHLPQADSLAAFLADLGANLTARFPRVADSINWIMLQYSTLPDEDKRTVQEQVLGNQRALKGGISQYVADEKTAERLAWLVYCSFLGYQQLFTKLELAGTVDLSVAEYGGFLAQVIDRGL